MFLKKVFRILQFIYILPATPCKGFHISRETDVFKNTIPIQRKSKVGKGLIARIGGQVAGRQYYCLRNRHINFSRKTIIKKFFVCAPPERIIDNSCSTKRGIFQKGAIERDILRYPV